MFAWPMVRCFIPARSCSLRAPSSAAGCSVVRNGPKAGVSGKQARPCSRSSSALPTSRWRASRPGRRRGSMAARSTGRGWRSRKATPSRGRCHPFRRIAPCPSFTARSRGRRRRRMTSFAPGSTDRRCSVVRLLAQARATARRSRTRSTALATATAIRSSSNPRASTIRRSIPTAFRRRCPSISRRRCFARSPGSRPRRC